MFRLQKGTGIDEQRDIDGAHQYHHDQVFGHPFGVHLSKNPIVTRVW
jgi:hypothetical protein